MAACRRFAPRADATVDVEPFEQALVEFEFGATLEWRGYG